jgi:UDPglucose 6-dehydrogenase
MRRNVPERLVATTNLAAAVTDSDVTLVAVGTPATEGQIDLRALANATAAIGRTLRAKSAYHTVIVKSTVIPGTTDGLVRRTLEEASGLKAGRDFGLGMNPEFLTEGTAVRDFMRPDRLVYGGIDDRTHDTLAAMYAPFEGIPVFRTNNSTAEMIKYASNCLLATMISFSNELARLCSALGTADVADVMKAVHASAYLTVPPSDAPRLAPIASFLEAGCGFGGSCLPKDVTALASHGESLGVYMPLLRSVLAINAGQPEELLRLVLRHRPDLRGVHVTVLGLAFKPDTDDVRESPALPVIERLRREGAVLTAYDPVVRGAPGAALDGVRLAPSMREALSTAEVVVLVTRWAEFQALADVLRALGRSPVVVDGRRVLQAAHFAVYEGIGR